MIPVQGAVIRLRFWDENAEQISANHTVNVAGLPGPRSECTRCRYAGVHLHHRTVGPVEMDTAGLWSDEARFRIWA